MENPFQKDIKIKKVIHNKYTLVQKIAVVNEAEKTSLHIASEKYGIDRKSIREWIAHKQDLINQDNKNKKFGLAKNAGHKSVSYSFEENILNWILYNRKLGVAITAKAIIAYTTKIIPEFKEKNLISLNNWFYRFMKRHNLVIRYASHLGQKYPRGTIDNIYNIYNFFHEVISKRRELLIDDNNLDLLVNCDETAVFFESPERKNYMFKGDKRYYY